MIATDEVVTGDGAAAGVVSDPALVRVLGGSCRH